MANPVDVLEDASKCADQSENPTIGAHGHGNCVGIHDLPTPQTRRIAWQGLGLRRAEGFTVDNELGGR
jgi:hypothetical protein